jgi:hypothetical protein
MSVQRVGIPLNQGFERVTVPRENALNDQLIRVVRINDALISPNGWLRRLHDNRVTKFPRFGQASPAASLDKSRHVS